METSSVTIATDRLSAYACLPQGKRAAICTDNVTDVSSKDDQTDSAQFVNSVDGFICQSTIIPADGRGFRMAISSQSISLADTFIGKILLLFDHQLLIMALTCLTLLLFSRSDSRHRPRWCER